MDSDESFELVLNTDDQREDGEIIEEVVEELVDETPEKRSIINKAFQTKFDAMVKEHLLQGEPPKLVTEINLDESSDFETFDDEENISEFNKKAVESMAKDRLSVDLMESSDDEDIPMTSNEAPTEAPTEAPKETPLETPTETLTETPIETPSETPLVPQIKRKSKLIFKCKGGPTIPAAIPVIPAAIQKRRKQRQGHMVCQDCPGWKEFGWSCGKCGTYHEKIKGKNLKHSFKCKKCKKAVTEWKCGCLKVRKSKFTNYIVGRRISLWWPKYTGWYSGIVLSHSYRKDGGTHNVLYDDDKDKGAEAAIAETLTGLNREKWYLL